MLDDRQQKFLDWLCTPPNGRFPTSEKNYAAAEGMDDSTLRRWKKKPSFKAAWEKKVSELQQSPERTQKLLDNLYERALNGDNNSAKLYLQATNRLAPMQVNVEHSQKTSEITDAELDALIASVAHSEIESRKEQKQL